MRARTATMHTDIATLGGSRAFHAGEVARSVRIIAVRARLSISVCWPAYMLDEEPREPPSAVWRPCSRPRHHFSPPGAG